MYYYDDYDYEDILYDDMLCDDIPDDEFDITSICNDGEIYSILDNKGYWVSKDGTRRYPNQFDYKHLVNTVRMIEREAAKYYVDPQELKIYNLLKLELKIRDSKMEHNQ